MIQRARKQAIVLLMLGCMLSFEFLAIAFFIVNRDAVTKRHLTGNWAVASTFASSPQLRNVRLLPDGRIESIHGSSTDRPELEEHWRVQNGKFVMLLHNTSVPWHERIRDYVPFVSNSNFKNTLAVETITWLFKEHDTFTLSHVEPNGKTTVRYFRKIKINQKELDKPGRTKD